MSKRTMIYVPQTVGAASLLAYNPATPANLPIGARRFILTGLVLTWEINKIGDTAPEVPNQDWLFRTITSLQLSDGEHSYLSLSGPDLRILYWHHRMRTQGRDRVRDYVQGGTSATPLHVRHSLPILFNPGVIAFDDSENIAGRLCGIKTSDSLNLQMGFGAAGTAPAAAHTVSDGVTTANSTTVTSATGGFVALDVGGGITITGAGPAGATLSTTITARASSNSITIATPAYASTTGDTITWTTPIATPSVMGSHSVIIPPVSANASWIGVDLLGYYPANDSEQPAWYPQWSVIQTNGLTQAYPSLGLNIPVPTGKWARRTTVMIVNGTAPADVRTNGFNGTSPPGGASGGVSEIGFITNDGREPVYLKTPDWAALSQAQFAMADDNTEYTSGTITTAYGVATAIQHVNPGVGYFDWAAQADFADLDPNVRANLNTDFGVNLIGKGSLALNTVFTVDTASGTNIIQLHEQYGKY